VWREARQRRSRVWREAGEQAGEAACGARRGGRTSGEAACGARRGGRTSGRSRVWREARRENKRAKPRVARGRRTTGEAACGAAAGPFNQFDILHSFLLHSFMQYQAVKYRPKGGRTSQSSRHACVPSCNIRQVNTNPIWQSVIESTHVNWKDETCWW
jgi:hypothetical protein